MRIVVALGGNALLRRGETPDVPTQLAHVREAAGALAVLATDHEVLLCHGNGPQVGLLALDAAAGPLDTLVAQTQGMIGYWLMQALRNAGVRSPAVTLVTQVLVDAGDPAFSAPTKPIGPVYDEAQAQRLAQSHGWSVARDGDGWRRVVPSPEPCSVVELDTVRALLASGALVVCGGGGGVPVVSEGGRLRGVEAVVDKDLTASMLAKAVRADLLLVLTDVPAVLADFGSPAARRLPRLTLAELAALRLPAGSMGPKVEACRRFVAATGRTAAIGALEQATEVVAGTAGTTITH